MKKIKKKMKIVKKVKKKKSLVGTGLKKMSCRICEKNICVVSTDTISCICSTCLDKNI